MRPARLIRGINRRLRGRDKSAQQLGRLRKRVSDVPRLGDEHWTALRAEVVTLAEGLSVSGWQQLSLHDRVAVWLVAGDHRADLTTLLVDRSENGSSFVTDVDLGLVARPGYVALLGVDLPEWLLVPHSGDLQLMVSRTIVVLEGEHRVVGSAYVSSITFVAGRDSIQVRAVGKLATRDLQVETFTDPQIDANADQRWCSQAESGFRATLDSATLEALGGTARLQIEVTSGPITRSMQIGEVGSEDLPRASVELQSASIADGWLTVAGQVLEGVRPVSLRLVGRLRTLEAPVTATGSGFTATVLLRVNAWGREGLAPETGDYAVEVVDASGTAQLAHVTAAFDATLPADWATPLVAARLSRRERHAVLQLRSPLPVSERGRLHQRLLRESVWTPAPVTLRASIVATCFGGRSGGDSVEPVVRELASRLPSHAVHWGVADFSVPIPEGFQPLLIHSRAWHEALQAARILVNNAHFPSYFRPSAGQTYLQTWHGTPLKKIGAQVPAAALSLSYRALMKREAAAWSLLLAQGPYAGQVLVQALEYDGPVLTTGYPRNDVLRAGDAGQRRAEVREMLGIGEGQMAVLYAPTWRDDAKSQGQQTLVSYLDASRLRERLGDHVVVLLRGHSNTSRGRDASTDPAVVDVTDHPDVAALFLAADVLVTDYSSVMFDFCVTGKPMIFLAPDLAHYRDSTRGLYLDLEEIAPGPVVASTDELADWLANLPDLGQRYAELYADFISRFAPYDDGAATGRVVDAVMAQLD